MSGVQQGPGQNTWSRRALLQRGGAAALGAALLPRFGWSAAATSPPQDAVSPAAHLLRRTGWGLREGDLEALTQLGVEGYLEQQLNPATLPDPQVDAFLGRNEVLLGDERALHAAAERDYGGLLELARWARLYRAAYSTRGLFERTVEVWTDHFNVPIPDLLAQKIVDDREVVRAHAFGRFGDLLLASAQSPAMLLYLNNASSDKEYPNENYARELLELHTLGVDGGYTERDVKETARALTGWTLHEGFPGRFYFDAARHDTDEKVVLGRTLAAGRGIEDGLEVLDLLAHHPATARRVALKLARAFVSDDPPEALLSDLAGVFGRTGGDLRAVLRALFASSAFWASAGLKFRRPLEHLVASLRALAPALTVHRAGRPHLIWALEGLGQAPYSWFPPDGYPQTGEAWLSTGGLLGRWNLALTLAHAGEGWLEGVELDLGALLPGAATVGDWVERAARRLTGAPLADADHALLVRFVSRGDDPQAPLNPEQRAETAAGLVGLLLASPQFAWA